MLSDKFAIITGAARGIGAEVAQAFAQEGAHVALIDCNQEKLEQTAEEIKKCGCSCWPVVADLKNKSELEKAAEAVFAYSPYWDILINNAGIVKRGLLVDFDADDWDQLLQVNLRATFLLSRIVAKKMNLSH